MTLASHSRYFSLVHKVLHGGKPYYRIDVPAKLNIWITETQDIADWVWQTDTHNGTSHIDVSEELYLFLCLNCEKLR